MSNFFEDLEAAAQKLVSSVSAEVTIAAREQKLKEAFQKLGRMHYQAIRSGNAPQGKEFDAQMAKIHTLQQEIQDLKNQENVASDDDFVENP